MLSKDVFNKGTEKLVTEYGGRGFEMFKDKALQWYEYMKNLSDSEFMAKIDCCLMNCNHVPYMSDIMRSEAGTDPYRREE